MPWVGVAALRQGPSAFQRTESFCLQPERLTEVGEVHEKFAPLDAARAVAARRAPP
jgi:hypothetical protein